MHTRSSIISMIIILGGLISFGSLGIAADKLHPKTTFKVDRAPKYVIPFERPNGDRLSSNQGTPLNLRSRVPTTSPGNIVGETYYDFQHNGSMGRQVASNQYGGYVFMTWMEQSDSIIPGDRGIRCDAYEIATGQYVYDFPGLEATVEYSGFVTCTWSPGSNDSARASFACHEDIGSGLSFPSYYFDGLPYLFILVHDPSFPGPGSQWYESEPIWPIIDAHDSDSSGISEDVIYVLTHVHKESDDLVLFRKVGGADFDQGQYIETVTNLSYTIAADPHSDRVIIVYTDDRGGLSEGEGEQVDLDVYCKISYDQGANWGSPIYVSNYTEDSLWRAFADLSVVITPEGFAHIIAAVRELRDVSNYELYKSRLVHWSIELNSEIVSAASVIDEARYTMEYSAGLLCDPDDWNLYIAKPSISYCNGNLYALYTKFGDDDEPQALYDCSEKGFANGELYLAASDDLGETWDTAWNLTGTRTPGCDSANCESDHWASMARYGIAYGDEYDLDTLDILYINDKDAGGIPLGSGTWCVNNVMHYRFPCRIVERIPRISLEPIHFLDPIHTPPYTELEVSLKISNIGNEELSINNINASDSAGPNPPWINLGSYSTPIAPGDFTILSIILNYGGTLGDADPASYAATIEINHDGPSYTANVPIRLTVASDFNMPQQDTLETGCGKKLMFYNTARLGGDHDNYALNIPGDCDSVDTPPNERLYLSDASPMIAWRDYYSQEKLVYTTVLNQYFTESGTFRPQSEINWYDEANFTQAVCTVTTSDSTYGIAINLYSPKDPSACFVLGKYTFFNWAPVKGADSVFLGFILDWDVPADESVDNGCGYNADSQTIWQSGAEYDSIGYEDNFDACGGIPTDESQRLGGIRVLSGPVTNAWTAENAPHQIGSGFDKDWLYDQMSGLTDYNMYTDTTIDLHTGVTFEIVNMESKAEYEYIIALLTTLEGEDDYMAQASAAYQWGTDNEIFGDFVCDCLPGDANGDGQVNIGDAVYLLAFGFQGGPAPTPYIPCSGDANMTCRINIADIVYIMCSIFRGGPAPPDCESWYNQCGPYTD